MKIRLFIVLFVALSALSANAADNEMIKDVRSIGFKGCNNAINSEFAEFIKSSTGRVTYDHFKESDKSLSILVTFGSTGDSILQEVVFVKDSNICYAYQKSQISTKDSCIAYKEKNPVWKYVESQGDFTWTKNKGGVDALFQTLPLGGCAVLYNIAKRYPVDK